MSQYAATVVARVLGDGGYDAHIQELRASYRARRDALAAALREHLPAGCRFDEPAGGFFIWLALPAGLTATALLPFAEERGVSFAPGRASAATATTGTCASPSACTSPRPWPRGRGASAKPSAPRSAPRPDGRRLRARPDARATRAHIADTRACSAAPLVGTLCAIPPISSEVRGWLQERVPTLQ